MRSEAVPGRTIASLISRDGSDRDGQKGSIMASANVKAFTDGNFKSEVLDSSTPVLVDFWAEWCQPCKMLGPTIDALADEFAGKVKVGKMDTDSNRNTAVQFGISAIPTVILFKGGQPVKKFVGLQGKSVFAAALTEAAT
jgi:thioredoxin 1